MTERVSASPTKDFFISMITRDISLEDCILDLLDNAIDGARSQLTRATAHESSLTRFAGFHVEIFVAKEKFAIVDNCGGIAIKQAKSYAFHFGRKRDAPAGAPESVGLYGIGMKRAMFKIGRTIVVKSSTATESFVVPIDVNTWSDDDQNWDFALEPGPAKSETGTVIEIVDLNIGVGDEFADPVFVEGLKSMLARDYSLVLRDGLTVQVNEAPVLPFEFGWLESTDFEPVNFVYDDGSVEVEITAGLSRVPPEEDDPGGPQLPDTQYYGWFVVCNDRVVLAGNKDDKTVWGDGVFPGWHPQYNGFSGTVSFRADDPAKLPWTTTKRGVDQTAPIYRRAIVRMKECTRTYIDYTNARKQDLEEAKRREQAARIVATPAQRNVMKVPQLAVPAIQRTKMASISYSVPERDFVKVARALGNERMLRREVGLRTFSFFKERMLEGED